MADRVCLLTFVGRTDLRERERENQVELFKKMKLTFYLSNFN